MLGYDVDFGHMQIIDLISAGKFSEKSVGYVAVALLMKADNEAMTLIVNSVRNDLISHNNYFQVSRRNKSCPAYSTQATMTVSSRSFTHQTTKLLSFSLHSLRKVWPHYFK